MFRNFVLLQTRKIASLPGNRSLKDVDSKLWELVQEEHRRQISGIELIASENFTSRAVLECLGSIFTNKYSEGYPRARYYGGNEVVDKVEDLAKERALSAYRLNPTKWGVNVQPYSGSPANFATYTALLQPNDRIMGLDLPHGGHLTHGYYTDKKRISASSIYFQSLPYRLNQEGWIDFDALASNVQLFKPKLLICGGSAYPRDWDYNRFRQVADSVGALLMMDMAHISGLVAAQVHNDPFEFCDVVTTTTHKSLRGPRAGMIFYRKELEQSINAAVFPAMQGGPHVHQIAAIATQLKEVGTPEFKEYAIQVIKNAKALASRLTQLGYTLSSGGTDNHLMLLNLRPKGITGSKVEKLLDCMRITVNKNSIVGDKSAVTPGGVRLGTCAMTTRGLVESDFEKVADFMHHGIEVGLQIQASNGGSSMKLAEFERECKSSEQLKKLSEDVKTFALEFPFPGFADPQFNFH